MPKGELRQRLLDETCGKFVLLLELADWLWRQKRRLKFKKTFPAQQIGFGHERAESPGGNRLC